MNLKEVYDTILVDPVYSNPECMEIIKKYAEREEKYRWHDLRKDPEDVPPCEKEVIVACNRKYIGSEGYKQIITTAIYEDGSMYEGDSIWCWEDLNGIYDEEKDDYLIPCGWWEYRHYHPDEVYNNVIDDVIIAWKEIEPFEEEE